MSPGHNATPSVHGPRIVLTKLRASIAVTLLYSLTVLVAAQGFSWLAQEHERIDPRFGTITIIFAVAIAIFWVISLMVIHRRRA